MRKILFSVTAIVFFLSCAGLENRFISSLSQQELEELKDLDRSLLDYGFSRDPALLKKIEGRVTELLKSDLPNKEYKAELLGILGAALWHKSDVKGVEQIIRRIEQESTAEPRLYTLRALLLKDKKIQYTLLEDGLLRTNRRGLIHLLLAELRFEDNDFRRALAAYDEAFLALPARYRELYQKKRDLAFQFIDQAPVRADTRELAAKAELTIGDVLLITLKETRYFDALTVDKNIPAAALLLRLRENGYLHDESLEPQSPLRRADLAFLLVRVVSVLENDPKLLDRHSGKYGTPSPVPDVSTTDYFYNAALVLVEREVLDLPDGKRFYPDRPVSGAEYLEILKKLASRYGR